MVCCYYCNTVRTKRSLRYEMHNSYHGLRFVPRAARWASCDRHRSRLTIWLQVSELAVHVQGTPPGLFAAWRGLRVGAMQVAHPGHLDEGSPGSTPWIRART